MIVIDASVACKWVFDGEENREKAFLLLKKHLEEKEKILVPNLCLLEIANTLATKAGFSESYIEDSLNVIFKAHLAIYHPNNQEVLKAAKLAKRYQTTVYDMLYAVIAKRHKTTLVTSDENFMRKTKFKFVKLIKDI